MAQSQPPTLTLKALLQGLVSLDESQDLSIKGLCLDNRQIKTGEAFLALPGLKQHGLVFAQQAVENGASVVLYEAERVRHQSVADTLAASVDVPVIKVPELTKNLGLIASRLHGDPASLLELLTVTGTNGKTSISHYLAQALSQDHPCGLIGTLGSGVFPNLHVTGYTTPDALRLHADLAGLVADGAKTVAMEVSSHALAQGRVNGLVPKLAVFTNLTRDHLDLHGYMAAYAEAKRRLFLIDGLQWAIIHAGDAFGCELLNDGDVRGRKVAFGLGDDVAALAKDYVQAELVKLDSHGMHLRVSSSWGNGELHSALIGRFNAENLLAVLTVLLVQGMDMQTALARLANVEAVPGRMQRLGRKGEPHVVLDFAHTPDALDKALSSLREQDADAGLCCVFGCGGDRDQGKRAPMGEVAERIADRVLLTDDNPRSENGDGIIQDIKMGLRLQDHATVIRNRRWALRRAVLSAEAGNWVLVAGKGHETEQQVGELRLPFNDAEVINKALSEWRRPAETYLSDVASWVGGELHGEDRVFNGVFSDSRQAEEGRLFIALKGPNFDAADYAEQVNAAGAAGMLAERVTDTSLPTIVVEDAYEALGQFAAAWRQRHPVPVMAITGSNGKTSVKEMLAAIMATQGRVLATKGNLNNEIGLPLTLLGLRPQHDACVAEMGANHAGEIIRMTTWAQPDIAMINNAAEAHLEGFGSLEGVSRAKGEIYSGLGDDGVAVINRDDQFYDYWLGLNAERVHISFGRHAEAHVTLASQPQMRWTDTGYENRFRMQTPAGEVDVCLALAGDHNVMNALAATAMAIAAGVPLADIARGLSDMRPVSGRLTPHRAPNGARIIDDAYNANPASLAMAMQVLASAPGRRTLVLGDMGELGVDAEDLHARIGQQAKDAGIERLFCVGPLSVAAAQRFGENAQHFDSAEALIEALRADCGNDDTVLVKASRLARLERVVEALLRVGETDHVA